MIAGCIKIFIGVLLISAIVRLLPAQTWYFDEEGKQV